MTKHRLIWYVWLAPDADLTDEQYSIYIDTVTSQQRKHDRHGTHTHTATFCTFYRLKHATRFARQLADMFNADIDVMSNRQRLKGAKRGVCGCYVVSPDN